VLLCTILVVHCSVISFNSAVQNILFMYVHDPRCILLHNKTCFHLLLLLYLSRCMKRNIIYYQRRATSSNTTTITIAHIPNYYYYSRSPILSSILYMVIWLNKCRWVLCDTSRSFDENDIVHWLSCIYIYYLPIIIIISLLININY